MGSERPPANAQSTAIPELPELDPGVTLLETDGARSAPLQTLAVDRLLLAGGRAVWVGTGQHCPTASLVDVAPDRRVLERIDLARGFTAYQHLALVDHLHEQVDDDTAVVVVPAVDARYREDVQGGKGRELLARALAGLARVSREHDVPVLCTRTAADEFAEPAAVAAASTLAVRETPMGPRFVGDEFETLVYPLEGDWVQTTIAFWREVLTARRPLHQTEVTARGSV
jgi:hypothetical protein